MEKGTNEMDPGAVESLVRAVPSPQSRIGGIGVVDPGKITFILLVRFDLFSGLKRSNSFMFDHILYISCYLSNLNFGPE